MTMKQLGERVGVESRSISAWENDEFEPRGNHIDSLADVLEFPKEFFFGDELDEPTADAVSVRALS